MFQTYPNVEPDFEYTTSYSNMLSNFPMEPLSPYRIIFPLISLTLVVTLGFLIAPHIFAERNFFRIARHGIGTVVDVKTGTVTEIKKGKRIEKTIPESTIKYSDETGASQRKTVRGNLGVGKSVQIFYDPDNPSKMKLASGKNKWKTLSWSIGVPLGGWGFISVWFLIKALINRRRVQRLISLNHIVTATIESVKSRVRRRSKYVYQMKSSKLEYGDVLTHSQFIATWADPQTGDTHRFFSVGFWGMPLHDVAGKKVEIFIDPSDPSNYYFGTDAVSNLV